MRARKRVALISVGIAAVAGVLIWIAVDRAPAPMRLKLADGRVVEVAGITTGESHSLPTTWLSLAGRILPGEARRLIGPNFGSSFGFGSSGAAIWLMCYDPAAGGYAQNWINTCTAVDEHGCEFPAQNFGSTGDGYFFSQVAFFPAYSRQGSFTCRIYDMNGKVLADLPIRVGTNAPTVEWTAESLPVWKTNGVLSLRLDGFETGGNPRFEMYRGGVREDFWAAERSKFEDASGNVGTMLCRKESAWRWRGRFHRTAEAPFASGEVTRLEKLPVAAPGVAVAKAVDLRIGTNIVTNITVAGPGKYEWSNMVLVARTPWRAGASRGLGSSSGGMGTIRTTRAWRSSDRPFLILPEVARPRGTKLLIRVREGTNIVGAAEAAGSTSGMYFYDLPQETPAGEVDLAFVLDEGYEFSAKVTPKEGLGNGGEWGND